MWMRKVIIGLAKPLLSAATGALALGGVWLAAGAVTHDTAYAQLPTSYNATKVEALTRPCFGVLLDPRMRCDSRYYRGSGYQSKYGQFGSPRSITINCDTSRPGYVERQIESLPAYSTVKFIAKSRSCEASLRLTRSITLVDLNPDNKIPAIVAPYGSPCLRVEPTADLVILRNMTMEASRGGNTPCVSSSGRELTFERSAVRYDGDASAVDIDAGRFNLVDSSIVARTLTAGLSVRNAELYAENSLIASTYTGMKADLIGDSRLLRMTFLQLADWQGFERGENADAVKISLNTNRSILSIDQSKILFYGNGLSLTGVGEALVSNSLFYSDHAITSDLDRVRILNNFIFANEIGVNIESGQAYIGRNNIMLVRTAGMLAKDGAKIQALDNKVEAKRCEELKWGAMDPAVRTCTPWYKGSAFDVPGGAISWLSVDAPLDLSGLGYENGKIRADQDVSGCKNFPEQSEKIMCSLESVDIYAFNKADAMRLFDHYRFPRPALIAQGPGTPSPNTPTNAGNAPRYYDPFRR